MNKIIHSWDIFPEYVKVMNEYLTHFTASKKYKQRDKDSNYLLMNGFNTLTHVFKIMLNKSNISEASISEAVENTEKAIYYYTQFIEQMDENIMYDLNVSSNSASLFVYKKNIYIVNNSINNIITEQEKLIFLQIEEIIKIYNGIIDMFILHSQQNTFNLIELKNIIEDFQVIIYPKVKNKNE